MKKVLLLACSLAVMGTCSAMKPMGGPGELARRAQARAEAEDIMIKRRQIDESNRIKAREVALQELQFLKARAEDPCTTPEDIARIKAFIAQQTEKIMSNALS